MPFLFQLPYSEKRCLPIAIYHMSIKIISRGKGKSAVAAAAYRAGEKITNEREGITHDYTRKQGVNWSDIFLPDYAPPEYSDRATLWNAVEKIEKATNSQLAREIQVALPKELSYFQNKALVREFLKTNFVEKGMVADLALHNMKTHNPHAHIMLTMRPFNEDGTWGDKQRKVYHLDENGDKIYDPKKRQYKCSKEQTTDWNERHKAEEWRKSWADICNAHLEKAKHTERVDHRSYADQGKVQIPAIHLGVSAHQMEQRGIPTERGDINRAIKLANAEVEKISATLLKLEKEMEQLRAEKQKTPSAAIVSKPVSKSSSTVSKTGTTLQPKKPATKSTTPKNTSPKISSASKPKLRTLQEVNLEIDITEQKLSRLDHVAKVLMSYDHSILDMQRNLSSCNFFERIKLKKAIAGQEQQRNEYEANAQEQYGYKSSLESKKSNLLVEKRHIENATGITAQRVLEQQQRRDEIVRQQQERNRYNAERRAKQLGNPSKKKDEPSL